MKFRLAYAAAVLLTPLAVLYAAEASRLDVRPVNGAPGWLLDGKPYVPVQAQAGRPGLCEVKQGRLWLESGLRVQMQMPADTGPSFAIVCTLTLRGATQNDGGIYFDLAGRTATAQAKRYPVKLGLYGEGVCGVMNWPGPDGGYVVRKPVGKPLGEPVRLRFCKEGAKLTLEADGVLLGEWTDPDPITRVESLALCAYSSCGTFGDLVVEARDGKVAFREMFDDPSAAHKRFQGDLPPAGPTPSSSFFSAGIPVYITCEWGPEMSSVWKEDGSFDWWEVDAYLRKLASRDAQGRLHLRFNFGCAPAWWRAGHADQIVHVRHGDSAPQPYQNIVSFASRPYWDECEKAARDLGRFCKEHPEGWRVVAVTYSGGLCEFFPHWGEGNYSDYSPAFLAGFRQWLTARYGDDAALRAAWLQSVTLDTAELPAPSERLKGDWQDFYDPSKGLQRIDFCRYYAEVTTGLITRLAKALKEGSDGRFYTRPMAGYQPGGPHFRFHAGPHADFASVLDCPWIDGFFMPHDYRGRGHGGFTAFEIPVASILLHGKTYIAENDDRTHLAKQPGESRTDTPWQTAQIVKRNIATALCYASGVEFKDWANGWWEDVETMAVIRQMNRLAQESVRHDRTPIARIAVVINPRSTMYVRDESKLYLTLNSQQMHLTYSRIGAPHDRILIDDLPKARDYDLYIVQDCLYLTDTERQMLKDSLCRAGKTVLWLYAPGIIGDKGISVDAVSALTGMKLAVDETRTKFHLKLSDGTHPYNQGVGGMEIPTYDEFGPLFFVDDPETRTLGMGWSCFGVLKPAFAVRQFKDWTSVYCSVPVLPPTVIRNIAREAGVHIYTDNNDFVAANNWLLCVCAASDGPRTIHLPHAARVVDALTGELTTPKAKEFTLAMKYGETRVWKLTAPDKD